MGKEAKARGQRNVPAWTDFWPLLSQFKILLFAGFVGSIFQALCYNLSIMFSAQLMKGGSKNEQELNDQAMIFIMLSMGVGNIYIYNNNNNNNKTETLYIYIYV